MRIYFLLLISTLLVISCRTKPQLDTSGALSYDPPGATDTRSRPVTFQERKTYSFNNETIHFSNKFEGARLNDVQQVNNSSFRIWIEAENYPINRSPWYGFKVWSSEPCDITVHLAYKNVKHRYIPKLTTDKRSWKYIAPEDYEVQDSIAVVRLRISADTLWVSAQELETSSRVNAWADSISGLPFVRKSEIGYSKLGQPIVQLQMGESDGRRVVAIIGRQHPPEVTGYYAMQEFVRAVAGNTELAREFRKNFEMIVVPLMNPDGVDQGHWRHNAGGVDLNRDWRYFHQPEPRAFRDFLKTFVRENKAKVYFGLDFHSTNEDIFYVYTPDIISIIPGFTQEWLKAIEMALPEFDFVQEAFNLESPISKNWFFTEFQAEAVTFEIGDETDRTIIRKKGRVAAEEMMKLLLEKMK